MTWMIEMVLENESRVFRTQMLYASEYWNNSSYPKCYGHQQIWKGQDSRVIDWDGLFIQESQWGRTYSGYLTRTYCEKTPQYKWHGMSRVQNPVKKDPLWIFEKDIVGGSPTSINGIGMSRVSGNNQAANWGRLFDMMEDQKESFMDKDML